MYHIKLQIRGERYYNGQDKPFDRVAYEVEADVKNKRSVFHTLMKEFGRCYGRVDMGYKFGKKEIYADGSESFLYTTVLIIDGAKPEGKFILSKPITHN